ncbi:cuticle protein [Holotrichia oblita]|uniref:Cuticle protein n=1 Tax=Holotrichia oblita TaxID=644536 RepID=A0ACB9TVP0_HOLOL|nr:cuticle protein [Holotrichia oblita]
MVTRCVPTCSNTSKEAILHRFPYFDEEAILHKMPRIYTKKTDRDLPEENMKQAITDVLEGNMSARGSATKNNVTKSRLYRANYSPEGAKNCGKERRTSSWSSYLAGTWRTRYSGRHYIGF